MPRYPTFPDCFDEVKKVSMSDLKRLAYLRPGSIIRGPIRWTRGGEPSGSIAVTVSVPGSYMDLDYNYGDKPISYRVRLESLPKHFGGCEWYFICPATGKRCRVLYGIGEYFLSRSAYPSAMYSQQTESKRARNMHKLFGCIWAESDFFDKKYVRTTYKGKLTKRYSRALEKQGRTDVGLLNDFLGR